MYTEPQCAFNYSGQVRRQRSIRGRARTNDDPTRFAGPRPGHEYHQTGEYVFLRTMKMDAM